MYVSKCDWLARGSSFVVGVNANGTPKYEIYEMVNQVGPHASENVKLKRSSDRLNIKVYTNYLLYS